MHAATTAPQRHRGAFALAGAVVVALDQLTKQLALSTLQDDPVDLVGSLRFRLTYNDGAAFNIGSGRTSTIAFIGLGVAAVLLRLGWTAVRPAVAVGYGIVFGGAMGNLSDRAFRDGDGLLGGRVVDFVDLQFWPVFNVADVALWIGIGVLLIATWREPEEPEPAPSSDAPLVDGAP